MKSGYLKGVIFLLLISGSVLAQENEKNNTRVRDLKDTVGLRNVQVYGDTLVINPSGDRKLTPFTISMMSAALPGLGQMINGQPWKVPIIYGALGTVGYLIGYNSQRMLALQNAYFAETDNLPSTVNPYPVLSVSRLEANYERFRRSFEFSILILGAVYGLNIVDAMVYAHLNEFDISEDLSLKVSPQLKPAFDQTFVTSLTLNFTIK